VTGDRPSYAASSYATSCAALLVLGGLHRLPDVGELRELRGRQTFEQIDQLRTGAAPAGDADELGSRRKCMGKCHPHRVFDLLTPEQAAPSRRLGAIRRQRRQSGALAAMIPTEGARPVCGLPR